MDAGKLLVGAAGVMVVLALGVGAYVAVGQDLLGGDGLGSEDLPAGVSMSGVDDASETARQHKQSLEGKSYTLELQRTRTLSAGGGTVVTQSHTVQADGDGNVRMNVTQEGTQPYTLLVWSNGSTAVGKQSTSQGTRYRQFDPQGISEGDTGSVTLGQFLATGEFTPEKKVTMGDQDLVVLTADEASPNASTILEVDRIESYSGTVHVTPDGVIYEIDLEITYVNRRNQTVDFEFVGNLKAVGSTSFERPGWVSEAISETSGGLVAPSVDPRAAPA